MVNDKDTQAYCAVRTSLNPPRFISKNGRRCKSIANAKRFPTEAAARELVDELIADGVESNIGDTIHISPDEYATVAAKDWSIVQAYVMYEVIDL